MRVSGCRLLLNGASWKKALLAYLEYYGDTCLEELGKITRHFSQDRQAVNQYLLIQSDSDINSARMSS